MKLKLIVLLATALFSSIVICAQLNPGGFNYTKQHELKTIPPITRLRISDAELIASSGLFILGTILPYIDKNNSRQGAEITCFVFSITLFVEGKRMRNNVRNKSKVRYLARKRAIPASKF